MTQYAESWQARIGVPESFVTDPAPVHAPSLPGGVEYGVLIESVRAFLDDLAGALPGEGLSVALAADLARWRAELADRQVSEPEQAFGHRVDLPGRGQVMAPAFEMTGRRPDGVEGVVTFGRYFLGGNGAVHGGAVALLFDEVLGRLSDTGGRPPARTASLTVDFRAVTPVGRPLRVRARIDGEVGRKRHLAGELWDGDVLCAEARGLFVALAEGQV